MARIEWAEFCELAFMDNCHRLCLIGITKRFPVPTLPVAVHQMMIAARVVDVRIGDELDIRVSMLTPSGVSTAPNHDGLDVVVADEYLLVTLHDIPFAEEGRYRFLVSAGSGDPVSFDVAVLLVSRPAYAEVH